MAGATYLCKNLKIQQALECDTRNHDLCIINHLTVPPTLQNTDQQPLKGSVYKYSFSIQVFLMISDY